MHRPSELNAGDIVADSFVIESSLGQSPSAKTFLANANHGLQKICLKIYTPELSTQFAHTPNFFLKAGQLASTQHDNLAAIYGVHEWEGLVCVAREWIEGIHFEQFALEQESHSRCQELLWQTAQSLVLFHENACHLNIHPENLLLAGFTAKLTDPDPRMLHGSDLPSALMPKRAEFRGYAAPETRRPSSLVYPSSDLYSLAGLLFRFITGLHPSEQFQENMGALAYCEREIVEFLSKSMHMDPKERFTSAEQFSDALWKLQPALLRQQEKPRSAKKTTPKSPPSNFSEASSGGYGTKTEVIPTESIFSKPISASGTLFSTTSPAPESLFDFQTPEPIQPPTTKSFSSTPTPPRKPLTSLEGPSDEGLSTFFGSPTTPKTHSPSQKAPVTFPLQSPDFVPKLAPKPLFSTPSPPPSSLFASVPNEEQSFNSSGSLTSLELDSADLTLSGTGPSSKTTYGFKGANPNQTLAIHFEKRRKSRKTLIITLVAVSGALLAFGALFFVLKGAQKGEKVENHAPLAVEPSEIQETSRPTPSSGTSSIEPSTASENLPPAEKNPRVTKETIPFPDAVEPPATQPETKKDLKPTEAELIKIVASQKWPPTASERLLLADQLSDYSHHAEANIAYAKSLDVCKSSKERIHALGGMGVTFDKMGMKLEAIQALDQLLSIQPNNSFAKSMKEKLK